MKGTVREGQSPTSLVIELGGPGGRFEREPDFGDRPVVRRLLPTARKREDCMGFVWDRHEGKLYLDLNGNRDLTDDPGGVFQRVESYGTHYLEGVRVQLCRDGVTREYVFGMRIRTNTSTGSERYWMTVRSGWRGKIRLHGKAWTLSVSDNLDGLIRGQDMCQLLPEPLSQNTVPHFMHMPQSLVLDGHVYDVDFAFETADGGAELVATFSETRPSMGTLLIEGQFIERLVLHTVAAASLMSSLALAQRQCRRRGDQRLKTRLLLWVVLLNATLMAFCVGLLRPAELLPAFACGAVLGLAIFLMALPFIVLASRSPFYHERLSSWIQVPHRQN
ncbi:hypothetical protein H8D79_00230 [PVC group bacterium]|nr:hypothetical protein [PVC group bacterium]